MDTSSDQQGNFVPATPVYLLRDGGYYNVPPTAHGADTTAGLPPVVWIPHEVDASGAGGYARAPVVSLRNRASNAERSSSCSIR